ncbi:2-oxoglutarate dehydrogenase complex dihydrolipoyllysine-residue succinyltransferase [Carboxylicivirga sp. A043]|uniref:2-oxoglutarate dehydrogenase complex dihydrolipoyllysine-residue succinyltransferase n=1 Tax=Carboxylicivirga litoralis TaxID=2816963 RepID=UPI0021CB90A5|nr:2-oxoglutarate dehydrogenase complex dihydrolipoyllysine-residue succinyltransferase [Carboxylicivirga sp. A043]MCU4157988.1 2-oxoglutarate dehydrogenase complex dihydrolipoyllysine-residue succinyltransferase [Carboxylicivirga sp. A043]
MIIEIKVPTPGESITEVELASWMVSDGDIVEKDQEIAEIESDKATLSLLATEAGKIKIVVEAGETIAVGAVACTVDTEFAGEATSQATPEASSEPAVGEEKQEVSPKPEQPEAKANTTNYPDAKVSPLAKKRMEEADLNIDEVINGLKRISTKEVEMVKNLPEQETPSSGGGHSAFIASHASRDAERQKMTMLRKKLSQRLVAVKNETAMLTTFNEVDMSAVMALRKKYQSKFIDKHGVKLGFMSFFIKAASLALKHHPMVNAMIDGDEIVIPDYHDVSVAVQTPKGLMVPVIRNIETLSLDGIETSLKNLAEKARKGKIGLEEMTGGTFTVTNGGVFGSMLSTPIINPPQSAIMGMHNIVERPVAVNGKVEIRPIMYLALSYDHRIIDGKDSVGFLVKVKEMIEDPAKLLAGGFDPEQEVLGL